MNVFPAAVVADDGRLRAGAGPFSVVLPRIWPNVYTTRGRRGPARRAAGATGGEGIRRASDEDNTVKLAVELVESLGSEVLLHLTGPSGTLVARVDPRTRYREGDIAELAVATEGLHAFDPETEAALF